MSHGQKSGGQIDEMSVGTLPTNVTDVDHDEKTKVYGEFNFEYRPKDNLPIIQNKDEITSMIQTHSITIIEGITGCGKSTQVPQFILDSCYKERKHCNIIGMFENSLKQIMYFQMLLTQKYFFST